MLYIINIYIIYLNYKKLYTLLKGVSFKNQSINSFHFMLIFTQIHIILWFFLFRKLKYNMKYLWIWYYYAKNNVLKNIDRKYKKLVNF